MGEKYRLVGQAHQSLSDEELMEGLARGYTGQLGELYLRYGDVVFRFICRLLVDEPTEQAEDLCQEVFLAVAASAPKYQEKGKLISWILSVAARTTRSWQRRNWIFRKILTRNKASALAVAAPIEGGPESSAAKRQEIELAMKKLTPSQREVVLLRTTQNLSGEEIAKVLDISENAVWLRLKRAHEILSGSIQTRGGPRKGETM